MLCRLGEFDKSFTIFIEVLNIIIEIMDEWKCGINFEGKDISQGLI